MIARVLLRRSLVALIVFGGALVTACVGDDPTAVDTSPDADDVVPGGNDGGTKGAKSLGDACSSAGECESGFCTDGVCCNVACSGQCEACAGATKGTCAPVTGIPIAPREACTGAGTSCGGTCDGTSTSCTYVAASTICGASCGGTCDGAGSCSDTGSGACAGGFACESAGQCKTTCAVKADCQPNFDCNTGDGTCVRIPESDCFDGVDNNGDGLADCQDPTCTADAAVCVSAVGAGAAIGTVIDQLPCPAGFGGATQPLNQGLQPGACSGCGCKTRCASTVRVWANAGCSGSSSQFTASGTSGDTSSCSDIVDASRASISISSIAANQCDGSGTNTWAAATPAWTSSKVFCTASRSSATCGQNQVCVPKVASGIASKVAAGGACPSGYGGANGTYYGGYTNGACGSCCTCSPGSTANCGTTGFAYSQDSVCGGGSQLVGANISNYNSSCNDFGSTLTIKSLKLGWIVQNDNCTPNKNITVQAAPTDGWLVCNTP